MKKIKISYICTVFNEEKTIEEHLNSILYQTKQPDEIIIVDGGSTDATASVISNFKSQISRKKIKTKFIIKPGNRAVGRNEAIRHTIGDIILISDSGCILNKYWVENITKPFSNPSIDVVSGYYAGQAESIFQKCIIPYVLVMPDKVNPTNFLPATRSMAIRKKVWSKIGGFDERFSYNEDYVFAKAIKSHGYKIVFGKNAIVYWKPRKNLKEAFIMFFLFALGDGESKIFRPKVVLIFLRYILFFYLIFLSSIFKAKSALILNTCYLILATYIVWSIWKNYRYIKLPGALFWLPVLQITSDFAVMIGTIFGLIKILI